MRFLEDVDPLYFNYFAQFRFQSQGKEVSYLLEPITQNKTLAFVLSKFM